MPQLETGNWRAGYSISGCDHTGHTAGHPDPARAKGRDPLRGVVLFPRRRFRIARSLRARLRWRCERLNAVYLCTMNSRKRYTSQSILASWTAALVDCTHRKVCSSAVCGTCRLSSLGLCHIPTIGPDQAHVSVQHTLRTSGPSEKLLAVEVPDHRFIAGDLGCPIAHIGSGWVWLVRGAGAAPRRRPMRRVWRGASGRTARVAVWWWPWWVATCTTRAEST